MATKVFPVLSFFKIAINIYSGCLHQNDRTTDKFLHMPINKTETKAQRVAPVKDVNSHVHHVTVIPSKYILE